MNKLVLKFALIGIVVLLAACKDDDFADYREAYIGVYDCTKSNRSFEDDMFTTEIEVTVILDSLSSNSVIANGYTIPIDDDGEFEGDVSSQNHDLSLSDEKIRWEINVFSIAIPGIALPCYIQGEKR